MQTSTAPSRKLHIEFLRILACLFVIFNHTDGVFTYAGCDLQAPPFWIYLALSVFTKFAVAMFFSISGALLLPKVEEPVGHIYKHRVLRFVCILTCWSFVSYLLEVFHLERAHWGANSFFDHLLFTNWNFTYWYLYAYIAYLLTLPLLRRLVAAMTDRDYSYLFGLYFMVFCFVPVVQYIFTKRVDLLNPDLKPTWVGERIFFFPVFGYFLEHRSERFRSKKCLLLLWLATLVALITDMLLTWSRGIRANDLVGQFYYATSLPFFVAALYLTARALFDRCTPPAWLARLLTTIGSCTLGVYLLHFTIKDQLGIGKVILDVLCGALGMNVVLANLVCSLLILLLCTGITLILKKIPVVRKLV